MPKPTPPCLGCVIGDTLGGGPTIIHYVRPIYPKEAKSKHIQGTVNFRAVITKRGELRNLELLRGNPLLVPAAIKAVRQWRYKPALINSEAVEAFTWIDVNFTLSQ